MTWITEPIQFEYTLPRKLNFQQPLLVSVLVCLILALPNVCVVYCVSFLTSVTDHTARLLEFKSQPRPLLAAPVSQFPHL